MSSRPPPLVFRVPMKVSGPNLREHHFARKRRVEQERAAVHGSALVRLGRDYIQLMRARLPAIVTFTRIGIRLLDDDNLAGSCKAPRDEVARIMGCGDGPMDPITWRYAQITADRYAVEIRIEAA